MTDEASQGKDLGCNALLGLLRHEAETHPSVYRSDRDRKELFAKAANEIERLEKRVRWLEATAKAVGAYI